MSAAVRSLWPRLVEGGNSDALYAIDSTLQELTFVVGPALVALLVTLSGTAAPLVASAIFSLVGTLAVAFHPAVSATGLRLARSGHAASPALFSLVSVGLLLIFGCAMAQIGVVGFATAHKAPSQSGLLLAVWSLGAITGGLCIGTRVNAAGENGLLGALGASGVGLLFVLAAPDVALLYPLIFIAGLGLVPALGAMYNLAGKLAPAHGAVEAFGWLSGGTQTGIAGGSALGGRGPSAFRHSDDFCRRRSERFCFGRRHLVGQGPAGPSAYAGGGYVLARGPPAGRAQIGHHGTWLP